MDGPPARRPRRSGDMSSSTRLRAGRARGSDQATYLTVRRRVARRAGCPGGGCEPPDRASPDGYFVPVVAKDKPIRPLTAHPPKNQHPLLGNDVYSSRGCRISIAEGQARALRGLPLTAGLPAVRCGGSRQVAVAQSSSNRSPEPSRASACALGEPGTPQRALAVVTARVARSRYDEDRGIATEMGV